MTIFPKNFLWGASTSSHQVEGNNYNNWSEWEKENAEKLARNSRNQYSWVPAKDFFRDQMESPQNYISGIACDHYNRYEEDFDILKKLGLNSYRFSIEWSRIEPEEGKFDQKELEHYKKVVAALRSRGIEPLPTLWHWTMPIWLRDKGGILAKDFPVLFANYSKIVVAHLKNDATKWITLNEPNIIAALSYLEGRWPPQGKSVLLYIRAIHKLISAHKKSFLEIKKIDSNIQVGIAHAMTYFEAFDKNPITIIHKILADWSWNRYFLNRISKYQDFIGLNFYSRNRIIGLKRWRNENKLTSDMGWELYPKGIYYVLKELDGYKKPIYITENGLADSQDRNRAWYIKEILKNLEQAISEDVDVRGYLYWSLLDNFEWADGYWPRFGLVEIDRKTLERKIRPSAFEFAELIKYYNQKASSSSQ